MQLNLEDFYTSNIYTLTILSKELFLPLIWWPSKIKVLWNQNFHTIILSPPCLTVWAISFKMLPEFDRLWLWEHYNIELTKAFQIKNLKLTKT